MVVNGIFWVKGVKLDARSDRLILPNGSVLKGNTFVDNGIDILIE